MNVSACLVTRGGVDMQPILDSLPSSWEIVIWDNGERMVTRSDGWAEICTDLSVYGRYAAIECASHELIYTVDDDVIVSDPQAIVDCWEQWPNHTFDGPTPNVAQEDLLVSNMPSEFRHDFYRDHSLVGFGAAFHRDAPKKAFERMNKVVPTLGLSNYGWWLPDVEGNDHFLRTCDVAFTALTPRVLVDVEKTNLPYADDAARMYRQQGHQEERARMLELALKVRDR